MLKISVYRNGEEKTLILEGKLAGAWVSEADSSWKAESSQGRSVRVDLAGVTFIDAQGKALLARLHQEGASLVGNGCLTKAIIAEVSGNECGHIANGKSPNRAAVVIKPVVIALLFLLLSSFPNNFLLGQ